MPTMPSGSARLLPPLMSRTLTCVGCRAFVAQVRAGGKVLCLLCAHHVIDHGVSLEARVIENGEDLPAVVVAQCDCLPAEIYPEWYRDRLAALAAASPMNVPMHPLMRRR